MNLTISAPSINLSMSMLFRILHILSILTGPNIFLGICLSQMRGLFSSCAVAVQVSDQYVTTGLIIVLYIYSFWCISLEVSILLVLYCHSMLCSLLLLLKQFLYSFYHLPDLQLVLKWIFSVESRISDSVSDKNVTKILTDFHEISIFILSPAWSKAGIKMNFQCRIACFWLSFGQKCYKNFNRFSWNFYIHFIICMI